MRTTITAKRLWTETHLLENPVLTIEDERIASIFTRSAAEQAVNAPNLLNYPQATLAPAFLDIHIHGAAGHDVMEATPEALNAMGVFLASHGTGSYLATTVTAPLDTTLRALNGLAKLIENPAQIEAQGGNKRPIARPIGIHLEGPFLSHAKRGVQPPEHLRAPDLALFDRFFQAAEGRIRLITLAPELPGAVELAAHATALGVRVSLGHSNATAAETQAAIDAGAVSATHTFNAMRPLDHREPGILGTVLTSDALYAELICDGIHTAPEMVKLWYRAKGPRRGILVTDAISATGMPDGQYQLGGFPVQVANGKATAHGVLAGSVLTLDRALSNFVMYADAPLAEGLRLLTANPGAMLGESQLGELKPGVSGLAHPLAVGQPANLVAVDSTGRLVASMQHGRLAAGL
jgi:N-acetylglucosamine-6-phosphate deacetylase